MFSSFSPPAETEKEEKKRGLFRSRSKVQKDSTGNGGKTEGRNDDNVEEDTKTAFWKGEKKQKAVVYTQFSDDPKAVLQVEAGEGIPELPSRNHVIVKVQVSPWSLGASFWHVSIQLKNFV